MYQLQVNLADEYIHGVDSLRLQRGQCYHRGQNYKKARYKNFKINIIGWIILIRDTSI